MLPVSPENTHTHTHTIASYSKHVQICAGGLSLVAGVCSSEHPQPMMTDVKTSAVFSPFNVTILSDSLVSKQFPEELSCPPALNTPSAGFFHLDVSLLHSPVGISQITTQINSLYLNPSHRD